MSDVVVTKENNGRGSTVADSPRRSVFGRGFPVEGANQPFRRDIQSLRGVAVLLVIANHAGLVGFAGGYIGVDMFFVISGYVITQLLMREAGKTIRVGLSDFYTRRIRRIVPAATVTLMATMFVAWATLGTRLNPHLPGDIQWASLFSANFRLIATGSNYFVPGTSPSLITQFWSLAVEEQFYLIFPLAIFLIVRYAAPERRLVTLRVFLIVGIALSAWWSIHLSQADPTPAYYSPFTRFWELGLGCLLATISVVRPIRTRRSENLANALGILLILFALIRLNSSSIYPGAWAWLPCIGTALIIWAGVAGERTRATRLLSHRTLGYIGDISYSLYLLHYLWLKLPEQLSSPLTGWQWRTIEIAGTFICAIASYHLIENPIRRSQALARDRLAVVLLLLVCIASSWTTAIVVGHLTHTA